ncbi:PRTRC system protein B [Fluviicola sp.]|uniref:PRTRC system protein B n=1 Tax=Fluviicola sp. TaxID=1917219 RepID=UPI0031DA92E4
MKDLTNDFTAVFRPKSALLIYQRKGSNDDFYVEHYDVDGKGNPINAHPLTVNEGLKLAKALQSGKSGKRALVPKGLIGANILYTDQLRDRVVWYTKGEKRMLHFAGTLGIPSGMAYVPPMLWSADREQLSVFALASNRRPKAGTRMYYAPFFNVYESGNVCMGNVDTSISESASLEEFTSAWENFFFGSRFTHLNGGHNPVKGNCVVLWRKLVDSSERFPLNELVQSRTKIKDLIR